MSQIGRNDPCKCGSGKKYKKCCGAPGLGRHTAQVMTPGAGNSLLGRIAQAGESFRHSKPVDGEKPLNITAINKRSIAEPEDISIVPKEKD